MNLIVCLDDKNGMRFFGRRQSADRVLARHILEHVGQASLWMSPDSVSFFQELPENARVDKAYLRKATEDDFCFAEDGQWQEHAEDIRTIIVYRWNRVYPADVRFPERELLRRRRISSVDFPGYSHERITQEIYSL